MARDKKSAFDKKNVFGLIYGMIDLGKSPDDIANDPAFVARILKYYQDKYNGNEDAMFEAMVNDFAQAKYTAFVLDQNNNNSENNHGVTKDMVKETEGICAILQSIIEKKYLNDTSLDSVYAKQRALKQMKKDYEKDFDENPPKGIDVNDPYKYYRVPVSKEKWMAYKLGKEEKDGFIYYGKTRIEIGSEDYIALKNYEGYLKVCEALNKSEAVTASYILAERNFNAVGEDYDLMKNVVQIRTSRLPLLTFVGASSVVSGKTQIWSNKVRSWINRRRAKRIERRGKPDAAEQIERLDNAHEDIQNDTASQLVENDSSRVIGRSIKSIRARHKANDTIIPDLLKRYGQISPIAYDHFSNHDTVYVTKDEVKFMLAFAGDERVRHTIMNSSSDYKPWEFVDESKPRGRDFVSEQQEEASDESADSEDTSEDDFPLE